MPADSPTSAARQRPNRIPLSVITGFLGSGKTTLINHLVNQPGMQQTALIINEFGEVGLDHVLVESAFENTLLLENGCICCSIRGDLTDTVSDLFAKVQSGLLPAFTRILIETTGLADPGPIVRTLMTEESVTGRCNLDCVVTLVDGVLGGVQLLQNEEAVKQVAQADRVLITKGDLSSRDQRNRLRAEITGINPALAVTEIEHGRIDPDELFRQAAGNTAAGAASQHHDHSHDPADTAIHQHGVITTWSFVGEQAIDGERLRHWLGMLFSLRPQALLRVKGLVRVEGRDQPLVLQAVGSLFSPPQWLDSWPQDKPETRLVFIFKGLSPEVLRNSFERHVISSTS
ncbi:MAG: GTP-binding protein [Rhodospirillales bacterium]|nr:GTP-binding protein [Rhodospirillales bacterium]